MSSAIELSPECKLEIMVEEEDFPNVSENEFRYKMYYPTKHNMILKSQRPEKSIDDDNKSLLEDGGEEDFKQEPAAIKIYQQTKNSLLCQQKNLIPETISDPGFVGSEASPPPLDSYMNMPVPRPNSACQFGSVKARELFNLSYNEVPKTNVCSRPKKSSSDSLSGWEPIPRTQCKHSKNGKYRKCHPSGSNTFNRLYYVTENKDIAYEFHHYSSTSQYMEQYRLCHTVGDVHRKVVETTPYGSDLFVPKLKSNIW